MFIKKKFKKKFFSFGLITKIYFFTTLIIFALFISFFFNTGIWINNKKDIINRIYFNGINYYTNIFEIAFKGFKKNFYDYEKISLNIPFENLLLLEENRNLLINTSISNKTFKNPDNEFVTTKAELIFKEKSYDVDIRLKGYRITHFKDKNKSSYKLTVKGEDRMNGLKEFSFIKPRMRNYIHEWLFHEFSSLGGLVKLKYEFLYLYINGSKQGLYVLEEGFNKELIERNKRRNGPIFSMRQAFDFNIFNSKLEILNKNYWNRKENLQMVDFAKKKFSDFLNGKIALEDTLDTDKWAWYFATMDLTYTHHGAYPGQVKLYYNPVSGLFEPLAYDGHRIQRNYSEYLTKFKHKTIFEMSASCLELDKNKCSENTTVDTTTLLGGGNVDNYWLFNFFYNSDLTLKNDFYQKYISAISKITNEDNLKNFFSQRKKNIKKINSAIYSDYFLIDNVTYNKFGPGFYYYSEKDIYLRANYLRNKFKSQESKLLITDNLEEIILENNSINNQQLKVTALHCSDLDSIGFKNITHNINKNLGSDKKIFLKKNVKLKNTKCNSVDLEDKFGNKFTKKVLFSPKIRYSKEIKKKKEFLKYFDITENDKLVLKNRITKIKENLFIPNNFIVKINSGEKIILVDNAYIYSLSPWNADGKDEKIEIKGEKDNFGGGLFISNASSISKFKNTNFSYLAGLEKKHFFNDNLSTSFEIKTSYSDIKINEFFYKKINFKKEQYNFLDGRILYGAINFYNTSAEIINCKFFRIDSEDALNFISTNYLVDGVNFQEINADAIDVDFGNGKIKNSFFENIGNDGIDLSGTIAELNNNTFLNVEDKIISVGENANAEIFKIEGTNSFIGIASKDGSFVKVEDITFNKVKIPFASYIKKNSYDSGSLVAKNIKIMDKYLVKSINDSESKIIIEGKKVENYTKDILDIIYKKQRDDLHEQAIN